MKIIRKVVKYIRTKFFPKKTAPKEWLFDGLRFDEKMAEATARSLEDIIEELARQAIQRREQHVMDLITLGLEPKICVKPPAIGNSEIIELENGDTVIRVKY